MPNTRYVFEKFEMNCMGDLDDATINYEVAGGFKGYFEGSYIAKPKAAEE
ncbi:MAG: hypothetical protein K2K97_01500 [Muribaculaceae bacterium]|nr:hypothetical protein [Muribaculaceae bacterium]